MKMEINKLNKIYKTSFIVLQAIHLTSLLIILFIPREYSSPIGILMLGIILLGTNPLFFNSVNSLVLKTIIPIIFKMTYREKKYFHHFYNLRRDGLISTSQEYLNFINDPSPKEKIYLYLDMKNMPDIHQMLYTFFESSLIFFNDLQLSTTNNNSRFEYKDYKHWGEVSKSNLIGGVCLFPKKFILGFNNRQSMAFDYFKKLKDIKLIQNEIQLDNYLNFIKSKKEELSNTYDPNVQNKIINEVVIRYRDEVILPFPYELNLNDIDAIKLLYKIED